MVGRTSSLLSRDIEFQVKALSVPLSLIRRMSGLDRDGSLSFSCSFGSLMGFGLGNTDAVGLRSHFGDRPRAGAMRPAHLSLRHRSFCRATSMPPPGASAFW